MIARTTTEAAAREPSVVRYDILLVFRRIAEVDAAAGPSFPSPSARETIAA